MTPVIDAALKFILHDHGGKKNEKFVTPIIGAALEFILYDCEKF